MISIAIIDVIGLPFDGSTLGKSGLGGSESAIILMSSELVKLGFDVTVFNNCIYDDSREGIYDGVKYLGLNRIKNHDCNFDIVISSRTVVPFIRSEHYSGFSNLLYNFEKIKKNAKHKIVWMHDTFCVGDHLLENLVVNGDIDEIFTLSDFHTSYITNCNHSGSRRMFEVLKRKIWQTRNGIYRWIDEVDIGDKDPDLFIYNASVTKGMLPLIKNIWPKIKNKIPNAKLKIIGGYYRFRKDIQPDEQEKTWHELVSLYNNKLNIEFTGVISQKAIAEICAKASFMIYPPAFPETFGISSLEALNYNTPLITSRFGALEEVATELSSYLMDYPIEPNSLYPGIDTPDQVDKFVDLVFKSYSDKYLLQQKQNYCNIFKDISGWNTVALQWKQHFYSLLNLNLSVDEFKEVSRINSKIHRIFQRRIMNSEEMQLASKSEEQHIMVISPFYNAESYIVDCVKSVASQSYMNFDHYLINDASIDNGLFLLTAFLDSLDENLKNKFHIIDNDSNKGAVFNTINTIRQFKKESSIIFIVDGDDKLVAKNDIFKWYNELYDETVEFTYGSCWSMVDNIPLIAQTYPTEIRENKTYRKYKFNWGIPYTHLRTFKSCLLDDIRNEDFQDVNGNWYKAGGDNAVFYNIIEKADPSKVRAIQEIHYCYNDINPNNDYKINQQEQTKTANEISNTNILNFIEKKPDIIITKNKKILLAIPTAKNIEVETFKSIFDLVVPDGYELEFQYFYGYRIDQIRNLIAHYTQENNFDYLFSVDSDIILPANTLVKMLNKDLDIISGVYLQRKDNIKIPELYKNNNRGGQNNLDISEIKEPRILEIDGCGFGCVLIKSSILKLIGYPQFEYHNTLDFQYTISEDVDFCRKAKNKGIKIFADTSIQCSHIGTTKYKI